MPWYDNPLVVALMRHFVPGRQRSAPPPDVTELMGVDDELDWDPRNAAESYERGWRAGEQARADSVGGPVLRGIERGQAIHGRTLLIQLVYAVRDEQRARGGTIDGVVELCTLAAEGWIADTNFKEADYVRTIRAWQAQAS